MDRTIRVTDVQQFSVHDGPGIRTVVFLKGCPLCCAWCHNPETQRAAPEIRRVPSPGSPGGVREELVGRDVPIAELLDLVRRDAPFYGREGGLTLSGGEPMVQPEGSLALLAAAREAGIGTCVETCGAFDPALVPRLAALADLVFFDLKDTDEARFRENTGGDLAAVLRTLRALDDAGADLALRCVLVPGVNLLESHARAVADVFRSLRHARCVELLPYHPWGVDKAVQTGRTQRVFETPDPAAVAAFVRVLREAGVPVKLARTAAALPATALSPRFTKALLMVPALSDVLAFRAGRRNGCAPCPVQDQPPEDRARAEALAPYFDGANFASRIRSPVRVLVGFADDACVPCAVYATYNEMTAPDRAIVCGVGMGHNCQTRPDLLRPLYDWLRAP